MAASLPVAVAYTLSWFGVFTFVNAYVVKGLGHANADWTELTLWFIGGTIFWQLLATEISMRIGRRGTVLLAMLCCALSFGLAGFTESLGVLAALLFLMAFMPASFTTAWLPMVADAGGRKPGKAMGISLFASNLAGAATLIAGGRMIGGGDYRSSFAACAVACSVCAFAFLLLTPGAGRGKPERTLSLLRMSKADAVELMKGSFVWILLAGICVEPFNFHTANQLFPNICRDTQGMGEGTISCIVALGRLPAIATLLVVAHIVDRMAPSRLYGIGIIIGGAGVVSMGCSGSALALVAGYVVFYLGQGVSWASNSASVNASVKTRLRDPAFAVMSVAMTASALGVGTLQHWLLSSGVDLPRVFVICGIAACLGGAMLLLRGLFGRRCAVEKREGFENEEST